LDWISFLAYPNLFGIKGFVIVVILYCLIGNAVGLKEQEKKFVFGPSTIVFGSNCSLNYFLIEINL
jgi:hypothetical protein